MNKVSGMSLATVKNFDHRRAPVGPHGVHQREACDDGEGQEVLSEPLDAAGQK